MDQIILMEFHNKIGPKIIFKYQQTELLSEKQLIQFVFSADFSFSGIEPCYSIQECIIQNQMYKVLSYKFIVPDQYQRAYQRRFSLIYLTTSSKLNQFKQTILYLFEEIYHFIFNIFNDIFIKDKQINEHTISEYQLLDEQLQIKMLKNVYFGEDEQEQLTINIEQYLQDIKLQLPLLIQKYDQYQSKQSIIQNNLDYYLLYTKSPEQNQIELNDQVNSLQQSKILTLEERFKQLQLHQNVYLMYREYSKMLQKYQQRIIEQILIRSIYYFTYYLQNFQKQALIDNQCQMFLKQQNMSMKYYLILLNKCVYLSIQGVCEKDDQCKTRSDSLHDSLTNKIQQQSTLVSNESTSELKQNANNLMIVIQSLKQKFRQVTTNSQTQQEHQVKQITQSAVDLHADISISQLQQMIKTNTVVLSNFLEDDPVIEEKEKLLQTIFRPDLQFNISNENVNIIFYNQIFDDVILQDEFSQQHNLNNDAVQNFNDHINEIKKMFMAFSQFDWYAIKLKTMFPIICYYILNDLHVVITGRDTAQIARIAQYLSLIKIQKIDITGQTNVRSINTNVSYTSKLFGDMQQLSKFMNMKNSGVNIFQYYSTQNSIQQIEEFCVQQKCLVYDINTNTIFYVQPNHQIYKKYSKLFQNYFSDDNKIITSTNIQKSIVQFVSELIVQASSFNYSFENFTENITKPEILIKSLCLQQQINLDQTYEFYIKNDNHLVFQSMQDSLE